MKNKVEQNSTLTEMIDTQIIKTILAKRRSELENLPKIDLETLLNPILFTEFWIKSKGLTTEDMRFGRPGKNAFILDYQDFLREAQRRFIYVKLPYLSDRKLTKAYQQWLIDNCKS